VNLNRDVMAASRKGTQDVQAAHPILENEHHARQMKDLLPVFDVMSLLGSVPEYHHFLCHQEHARQCLKAG
jgi:hypothetical protein